MINENALPADTERLQYRLIQPSDGPFLFQLMNTEKWLQHIGDKGVNSVEATHSYIAEKMGKNVWSKGFVNYIMSDKQLGKQVGTCSLHNRDGINGLDIGCALLPKYERKGYAKEGVEAMINLAFNQYHQVKVSAITSVDNQRSYEGLEKLGFVFKKLIQLPHNKEQIKLYQYNRKI